MLKNKKKILILGLAVVMGIGCLGSISFAKNMEEKGVFKNIENIKIAPRTQLADKIRYVEYRIEDKDTNQSYDTIWKYANDKKAELIAKSEYLDFLSCKSNGNIAVLTCKEGVSEQKKDEQSILKVMDTKKSILFNENLYSEELSKFFKETYEKESIDHLALSLKGWSDDGKYLWVQDSNKLILFRINISTKKVDILDQPYLYTDNDLNYNTGWACASDYPEMFDIDDVEQMKKGNSDISLKLINVITGETKDLASKKTSKFSPKWIDDNNVMYKNNENNWIIYKMK